MDFLLLPTLISLALNPLLFALADARFLCFIYLPSLGANPFLSSPVSSHIWSILQLLLTHFPPSPRDSLISCASVSAISLFYLLLFLSAIHRTFTSSSRYLSSLGCTRLSPLLATIPTSSSALFALYMIASFLLPQLERWPTTFFYIKAAIAAIPWPARFASSHPLRIFLDARSILLSSGLYPVFSRQGCLISMWLLLSFYILFALTPLLRFTLSCLYKTALLPTKLFAQNTSRSDLAVIIAEIKAQAADRDAKHSLLLQQTFTAFALELRDHSARLDASFAQRSDFVQQSDLVRTSDLVQNSGLAQRSDSPQNPDNAPLDALSKQIHKLEENSRFRSYEHRLLIGENKRKLSHELCTYRGDVMLHINKLSEWLNGELPKHLEAQGSRLYSRLAAYFDLADVHQLKLAEGLEEQIKHYTEQHASVLAGQIYNMAVNVHQTASRFNEWEKEVSSRLLAIEDALHIPQRPPLKEINQPSA